MRNPLWMVAGLVAALMCLSTTASADTDAQLDAKPAYAIDLGTLDLGPSLDVASASAPQTLEPVDSVPTLLVPDVTAHRAVYRSARCPSYAPGRLTAGDANDSRSIRERSPVGDT